MAPLLGCHLILIGGSLLLGQLPQLLHCLHPALLLFQCSTLLRGPEWVKGLSTLLHRVVGLLSRGGALFTGALYARYAPWLYELEYTKLVCRELFENDRPPLPPLPLPR